MIIDIEEITNILTSKKIKIIGCIHVGSQSYIEDDIYKRLGIETANIVWIDAHPQISQISQIPQKSITLDTLFERNNIDASKYNFWRLDIKATELLALEGAMKSIKHVKALYIGVNSAIITELDALLAPYNFKRYLTKITIDKWGEALYILDILDYSIF
jgi:hypothetical protein